MEEKNVQSKTKELSTVKAVILLVISILGIVIGKVVLNGDISVVLIVDAAIVASLCMIWGIKWADIEEQMKENFKSMTVPIVILMCVGMLVGIWITSGTIPTMIYYGNSALSQTVMAYYTRLCMGNPGMMAYAAVVSRLGSFVCIFTCSWFAKKLGRGNTAILSLGIQIIINIFRFVTKDANGYVMLGCMGISGVFGAMFLMMHMPCLMDSIDYGEWKTGVRSDGLLMSANSLGNKIGAAIGGSAVGYLLAFTGYDKNLQVQPAAVVENVRGLTLITPIVVQAIVIGLYMIYRKK